MATRGTSCSGVQSLRRIARRQSVAVLFALLLALLGAAPASAGEGAWTPVKLGPKGQGIAVVGESKEGVETSYPDIKALAVDPSNPNVLIAGGSFGLYRSADHGKTWTRVLSDTSGEMGAWVNGIHFDKGSPSIVYATTDAQFG